MMREEMTIHKALCELKVLNARIDKAMMQNPFVFANKHSNTKVFGVTVTEYCEGIKASYQSVVDLIARRDAIKRAVTVSNAKTEVAVAGKKYSVAEAIEMKNHGIPIKKGFLQKMIGDNRRARNEAESKNGDFLEARADEYLKATIGNCDMKGATEEIQQLRAGFIASQTMEIVDPIGILKVVDALEKEISEFEVDVDSALSVSNATTMITVEY